MRVQILKIRKEYEMVQKNAIQLITEALGSNFTRNTESWGTNWVGITHSGKAISVLYKPSYFDCVEVQDTENILDISTDSFGIGFIEISELSKYFKHPINT